MSAPGKLYTQCCRRRTVPPRGRRLLRSLAEVPLGSCWRDRQVLWQAGGLGASAARLRELVNLEARLDRDTFFFERTSCRPLLRPAVKNFANEAFHLPLQALRLRSHSITLTLSQIPFPPTAQHVESSSQKRHSSCHQSSHPGLSNWSFPRTTQIHEEGFETLYSANREVGWRPFKRYSVSATLARSSKGQTPSPRRVGL